MFDIGGWEFLVIIVIAIVVIGPKDLPATIRTVTGWIRKARELAREFQNGIEDLVHETEMDSVKNDIQSGLGLDEIKDAGNSIRREIENSVDGEGEIRGAFNEDDPYADSDFGGEADLEDYSPPTEEETRVESAEAATPAEPDTAPEPEPTDKPPAGAAGKA